MAERVSSVITIANVSLLVIEVTAKYIREINLVNDIDLLRNLKDLHRLTKVVASIHKRADPGEDNLSSRFLGKTLTTCQARLEKLKPLVYDLASLESQTWPHKWAVGRRSDKVKKDIESIIQDIHRDMEYISVGLSCWFLDSAAANRRISEAITAQPATNCTTKPQDPAGQDSMKETHVVYSDDADSPSDAILFTATLVQLTVDRSPLSLMRQASAEEPTRVLYLPRRGRADQKLKAKQKSLADLDHPDSDTIYSINSAPDDSESEYVLVFAHRLTQDLKNASGLSNISLIPSSAVQ